MRKPGRRAGLYAIVTGCNGGASSAAGLFERPSSASRGKGPMVDRLLPMLAGFGLSGALLARSAFTRHRLRRQLGGLEEAFRSYSVATGMTLIPASTGWDLLSPGDGTPPALGAELHGFPLELRVHVHGNGVSTRVEAAIPGVAADFCMAIHRRGALTRLRARRAQMAEARTGNKVFDRRFALLSNDADQARSIVDRRLAQVVGSFPRQIQQISVSTNRFTLAWGGAEREPAVLDAAFHLVWTGCRRRA